MNPYKANWFCLTSFAVSGLQREDGLDHFLSLEVAAGHWKAETFFVGKEDVVLPGTAVTHEVNGLSPHGTLME